MKCIIATAAIVLLCGCQPRTVYVGENGRVITPTPVPVEPIQFVKRIHKLEQDGVYANTVYTYQDRKTGACWLSLSESYGGSLAPAPKETCE